MKKKMLVILVAVGMMAVGVQAALEVGVGKTYSTIQAAVDAAVNFDEIIIYAGVYNETVTITGKNDMKVYANPGDKVVIKGGLNLYNPSGSWSDRNTFKELWIDRSGFASGWAVSHQYARNNTYQNCVFFGDNSGSNGIYGYLEYGLNNARHCTFYGLNIPYSHNYASGLHVFDSIVAFNGGQSYNYSAPYNGVATYSDYYKNPVNPGIPDNVGSTTGTINQDPQFFSTDPTSPYFLCLGPMSPCNGTAQDGMNMGALPTVPEPMSMLLLSLGALMLRKR